MKTILHKASTRAHFDYGWLRTSHTFSFADYHDPERVNFGALRVLNDDVVAPGMGFDEHSHRDMEIVTIPLNGALEHKDNLGHSQVIRSGEIQAMSAGSGITHSEYNKLTDQDVEFLQIWVFTEHLNLAPRYERAEIAELVERNEISTIVSPYPGNGKGLWIYQQAWFSMAETDAGRELAYTFRSKTSFGVYLFVIDGRVNAAGEALDKRDGLGIEGTEPFNVKAETDARILFIEVPPVSVSYTNRSATK